MPTLQTGVTRPTFWRIGPDAQAVFYVLAAVAILVFSYGVYRRIARYRRGAEDPVPRVDRPLATYLETLPRLEAGHYDRLHPGHRDPIDDPADRIHTIVAHHEERTERVRDVLEQPGPATAWTVSDHLFGELTGIHVLHGPGEAWAHLEELVADAVAERDGIAYRLVDGPAD